MKLDDMILGIWVLSFKLTFSLSSFSFIKRLFSSFSFSDITLVSFACHKLLIFPPAILIPARASFSPTFHMMYSASWETYMQVRKQQLELHVEQQTGSKQEKEYVKAVYCLPAYLTCMQSTSWEKLCWRTHTLESRLPGEISITSGMQMTPPLWQKVKRN